jgi:hypothetical protein
VAKDMKRQDVIDACRAALGMSRGTPSGCVYPVDHPQRVHIKAQLDRLVQPSQKITGEHDDGET